ncbi:MAG: cation-translocating P-type ATPase [Planctomycetota bacterium]|jgi:Ca2+-transporting ATPase
MEQGYRNPQTTTVLSAPWAITVEETVKQLRVVRQEGLDRQEVHRRLKNYGPNRLRETEKKSVVQIFINQLKSLIVLLLAIAAGLSFAFHEWVDGIAISGVIVVNTLIGFFMELKAIRSMEALKQMERVSAKVRRSGKVIEIPARQLVPGDVVVLEGGDIISADMRLIFAAKIQANESVLTGESLPISKHVEPVDETVVLGDRTNMLFKGTAVTRGSAEAVVVATGMDTELGRITDLVQGAKEETTPLEKRLDSLGRKLLWVTLLLIVIIAVAGIARGRDVLIMIETAIALAVAAIPEGLPIVATLALARGMLRMAGHNAMVNQLAAVETLGGVSVICTDKTGTLTENRMTVTDMYLSHERVQIGSADKDGNAIFTINDQAIDPAENKLLTEALEIGVLCNNASLEKNEDSTSSGVGDPLEVGLLIAARKASIDYEKLNEQYPEDYEDAFDSDTKRMATFNRADGNYKVAVKGALETVLESATRVSTEAGVESLDEKWTNYWLQKNTELAEQGYRVLALAAKQAESIKANPYEDLTFLGLVCMEDPARDDVRDAIQACREAGVQIVMITGDHPITANSIASSIGLTEPGRDNVIIGKDIKPYEQMTPEDHKLYRSTPVFARVSPKQKLDLIAAHQQADAVVAMTGDGVNDAPALKKADIGVAMGLRGTQVAREAADMVLKDDKFSTIVIAVEQGRVIFENIRKFIIYLLSCNISEIMVVFAASIVNAPLPILPLQILFLNLVTDVFPALALGAGRGNPGLMKKPPRPSTEPILSKRGWYSIFGYGALITLSVLSAFGLSFRLLGMDQAQAVTVSFLTLAFAQLWHVFNMRSAGTKLFKNEVVENPYVWAALGVCILLLLAAVYVPLLSGILKLTNPGTKGWTLVITASLITCLVGQLCKQFGRK